VCLPLCGGLVTFMDCQRAIVQPMLDQGADYLLALKDNQPLLAEEGQDAFGAVETCAAPPILITAWPAGAKRHDCLTRRTATLITDVVVVAWLQPSMPGQGWPP
jgi:hypothetical protein